MDIPRQDIEVLCREKYAGDQGAPMHADIARLMRGEPLAYVIGTQPFLGVTVHLDSKPLIPRPETEWWTEALIQHIGSAPLQILDLCTGSGAIGLAILKHCPNVQVSFTDIHKEHVALVRDNLEENKLDVTRAHFYTGDLFTPLPHTVFNIVATNPPYIPYNRTLSESVTAFEPHDALFAGTDGLDIIRVIAKNASHHIAPGGELWMECDIEHIQEAELLLKHGGAKQTHIRPDHYGRPRLVIAYY